MHLMKLLCIHKENYDKSANMNTHSPRMNDDPEEFHKRNRITRIDSIDSIEEYADKFKWKTNERVLDIGSADGSVTNIISNYLPKTYEILIGCDINKNSVKFANARYSTNRIQFIELDIEAPIPEIFKENFDHVFSFYTLHWLSDPVKGYRNVYNVLKAGGECFLVVSGRTPFYDIFHALTRSNKWAPWMKDYDDIVSPYHDSKDPDKAIYDSLLKIGFNYVDIRCKQKLYIYESTEALKRNVTAINPFKIPNESLDQFIEDYVNVARDMRLVQDDDSVKFNYNLIIIHCIK